MPLSEHEQRLLEQMERALHAEDPRLASTLRNGSGRSINGRGILLGALGVVAGLAALLGGVITSIVVLGVVGFLLMLGGVLVIGAAMREPKAKDTSTAAGAKTSGRSGKSGASAKSASTAGSSSFMSRVEERWRKRREGQGF